MWAMECSWSEWVPVARQETSSSSGDAHQQSCPHRPSDVRRPGPAPNKSLGLTPFWRFRYLSIFQEIPRN